MRVLAVLLVAVVLGGCVVTVPLRTADASSDLLYERPIPQATVERLDSLGRVMPAEIPLDFRFTPDGAWWMQPNGAIARVPRSRVHSVEVVEVGRGNTPIAFGLGFIVGVIAVGVPALREARTCEGVACGLAGLLATPGAGLLVGAAATLVFPESSGPVRYVVTPERRR